MFNRGLSVVFRIVNYQHVLFRGNKVVVKFFPHSAADLEPVAILLKRLDAQVGTKASLKLHSKWTCLYSYQQARD